MGWNEARAILPAPGWRIVVEESTKARTADGSPVQLLHLERIEESSSNGIDPAAVQTWLQDRGFEFREQTANLVQLALDDIDAVLCIKGHELADVSLKFTLKRNSPSRWAIWKSFVEELSEAWGLDLYDPERGYKVDASEILGVLAGTRAWKDFEANFNWPLIT